MAEKKKESPEYIAMRDLALSQLKSGKSLTGEGGVFAPIIKEFLESALSAEMECHLDEEERSIGNKRNGKSSKTLKTSSGEITIETPQDRHSSFEPQIVKKRETILADNLAPQIIGLYGRGMSLRDISIHIQEMYDVEISATTLSEITDRVIPQVKEWQNRPLDEVYPIVWMDAMHYKVRDGGKVTSRAVYNILAINKEGRKELIGMYISESEGANFWLSVLTDLKSRGVKDILIACTDNLKGFSDAILSIYPETEIQKCVIHQIRNSLKYVASKDQKTFMKDLKKVYQSATKSQAEMELLNLEEAWGKKYPIVIKSWHENWEELTTYFQYDEHIRKIIYTTNAVEGFHRQIRKVTKTKGAFPSDMALMKLIYLATENISKKWTQPVRNWGLTIQQFCIKFGDRMKIDL
ncbi:IS256 family transposase [Plebeiibacterium sediminum]|uniref:Mutator family transposase n=1 Tax=Plebeiibacterium sediminum TaxID=2992112 RepID=A0AAE3SIY2_9BACT|nr:IS256 family transposase [Plebeiobacterium sediminum]MCW3789753.1 IS256 family transposase [Plebeiobacterium sediminum]